MKRKLWQGTWCGRSPDGDQHQRSREVVRPTGGIVRGKFPSRKNGRMVHHEGLLELDAIYLFEASPKVVRYQEQPTGVRFPDGAQLRRYTPDFELVLDTGEVLLAEIKPVRSLENMEVKHKLDSVTAHLKRSEVTLITLTDAVIRREPYLSNLKWIYHRASRIPPTFDVCWVTAQRYRSLFPLSIREAAELFHAHGIEPYSMLLAGLAVCELEQTISDETKINLIEEGEHVWFWISPKNGF